jgi:hypothetical protein
VNGKLFVVGKPFLGIGCQYPVHRRLGGPQTQLGCCREGKSLCCCCESNLIGYFTCSLLTVQAELFQFLVLTVFQGIGSMHIVWMERQIYNLRS